jgi:hypothetical protein
MKTSHITYVVMYLTGLANFQGNDIDGPDLRIYCDPNALRRTRAYTARDDEERHPLQAIYAKIEPM